MPRAVPSAPPAASQPPSGPPDGDFAPFLPFTTHPAGDESKTLSPQVARQRGSLPKGLGSRGTRGGLSEAEGGFYQQGKGGGTQWARLHLIHTLLIPLVGVLEANPYVVAPCPEPNEQAVYDHALFMGLRLRTCIREMLIHRQLWPNGYQAPWQDSGQKKEIKNHPKR